MSKQFYFKQFSLALAHFSSIWPRDRTLSSATMPSHRWLGSDGTEGVLCIPQSSNITGTSPSDCLVSYRGHLLGVSNFSARNSGPGSNCKKEQELHYWMQVNVLRLQPRMQLAFSTQRERERERERIILNILCMSFLNFLIPSRLGL